MFTNAVYQKTNEDAHRLVVLVSNAFLLERKILYNCLKYFESEFIIVISSRKHNLKNIIENISMTTKDCNNAGGLQTFG